MKQTQFITNQNTININSNQLLIFNLSFTLLHFCHYWVYNYVLPLLTNYIVRILVLFDISRWITQLFMRIIPIGPWLVADHKSNEFVELNLNRKDSFLVCWYCIGDPLFVICWAVKHRISILFPVYPNSTDHLIIIVSNINRSVLIVSFWKHKIYELGEVYALWSIITECI